MIPTQLRWLLPIPLHNVAHRQAARGDTCPVQKARAIVSSLWCASASMVSSRVADGRRAAAADSLLRRHGRSRQLRGWRFPRVVLKSFFFFFRSVKFIGGPPNYTATAQAIGSLADQLQFH